MKDLYYVVKEFGTSVCTELLSTLANITDSELVEVEAKVLARALKWKILVLDLSHEGLLETTLFNVEQQFSPKTLHLGALGKALIELDADLSEFKTDPSILKRITVFVPDTSDFEKTFNKVLLDNLEFLPLKSNPRIKDYINFDDVPLYEVDVKY